MISIERDQVISQAQQLMYLKYKVSTLWDAIKHGDQKHREWLKDAINAHFAGEKLPDEKG